MHGHGFLEPPRATSAAAVQGAWGAGGGGDGGGGAGGRAGGQAGTLKHMCVSVCVRACTCSAGTACALRNPPARSGQVTEWESNGYSRTVSWRRLGGAEAAWAKLAPTIGWGLPPVDG